MNEFSPLFPFSRILTLAIVSLWLITISVMLLYYPRKMQMNKSFSEKKKKTTPVFLFSLASCHEEFWTQLSVLIPHAGPVHISHLESQNDSPLKTTWIADKKVSATTRKP